MGAILGLFGTGDFAAEQRPRNWRETILMLEPTGDIPLTALTSQIASEGTNDPEFNWWQEAFTARIVNTVGPDLAASTAGTVDTVTISPIAGGMDAFFCPQGTLLRVQATGEIMRVASDPTSANTVSVVRGWGLPTGFIVNASVGGSLAVIGSAYAEGSGAPSAVARVPTKYTNYTQIFKDTVEHTNTARVTKTRTGDQISQDHERGMKRHMQGMEQAFFFGQASETYVGGQPLRTTKGLINWMNTNVEDYAGIGTLDDLDAFYQSLFLFGSDQRVAFVGNAWISRLNKLILNSTQYRITVDAITEYGYKFNHLMTPYGEVYYRRHPLFNVNPDYNNSAWHLSFENLKYRCLPGRDTHIEPNVQLPGDDKKKDLILTECGLELHHEETFGLITNL
jgi:hypothetical protein